MLHQEWSKSGLDIKSISEAHSLKLPKKKLPSGNISPAEARAWLLSQRPQTVAQTLSFQMLKGGVAKTTSVLNIGLRAAHYGLRVLLVDLDLQANLTFALGAASETHPVWVDVVDKKTTLRKTIIPICENLDLIPSNLNNSVLEKVLIKSNRNWAHSVKHPLQELKNEYDWIIIDTAPNLSLINTAVTCASHLVVLPVTPEPFAISGLEKHLEELAELKNDFDLTHLKTKILFTRFDAREKLSQSYLDKLAEEFPDELLDSYVRSSSEVKNSVQEGRTLFQHHSSAKEDYDLVTKELIEIIEGGKYAEC